MITTGMVLIVTGLVMVGAGPFHPKLEVVDKILFAAIFPLVIGILVTLHGTFQTGILS